MKKIKLILISTLVTLFYLTSCSNDENLSNNQNQIGDEQVAEDQNATENTKIEASVLEQGVLIEGATKKTGNPPAPNNELDFKINTNQQEAFQNSGFNIEFSSTANNIEGAYIRFKDSDGKPTSTYFDVPVNKASSRKAKSTNLTFISKKEAINEDVNEETIENTSEINVDFSEVIPAGKFCYDICIYDNENNISTIETVCVTIEAWGGNAKVVGRWTLENIESNLDTEDDPDSGINVDVECTNGGVITAPEYEVSNREIVVSFNQDGTYSDSIKGDESVLNYDKTAANCSPVFDSETINLKRSGNWAYNEDNNSLTMMIFKIVDLVDASESEEFEFGEAFFDGLKVKEVTDTRLILEERYDFNFEGIEEMVITYTFKK